MNKKNEKWNDFMIYVMDHKKKLMPLALILGVALTVFFAITANERAGSAVKGAEGESGYDVPIVEVQKNAYPEVNELIRAYYKAWAVGDTDTIDALYHTLDETERLKTVELSKYIEDVPEIDVYTKPGPEEGTYVVYPYITVKFHDYAENVPGIHALYVCTDEDGSLFINSETSDDHVKEYIREISLQNDVIDLFSSVSARFNEMKAQDEALDTLLSNMLGNVSITVGEALATNMAAREDTTLASAQGASQDAGAAATEETAAASTATTQAASTQNIIRATDVVNIRTSDSETADKIDKTAIGDEFTQLEARANGWSKIMYEGREAFVKTEFFEVVGSVETEQPTPEPVEVASATASTEASTSAGTAGSTAASGASTAASGRASTAATGASTASSAASTSSAASGNASTGASSGAGGIHGPGDYHVKETTRVRASASTEAEILAVAYQKNPIEVINVQADGWSKVKYEGKTGYVKTEYLTD